MFPNKPPRTNTLACLLTAVLLAACAAPPVAILAPGADTAAGPTSRAAVGATFRCDRGGGFSIVFRDDSAFMTSASGRDVLLRDAGGLTPTQTVYSNSRVRAEFGLGAGGHSAVLNEHQPPVVRQCSQNQNAIK